MPEEIYEFSDATYERLDAAGVSALQVLAVLHGGGAVVRRHIGSALQIAGRDRAGVWLAVGLVETSDDRYTVTGARRLDDDENAVIARLRKDQP